MTKDSDGSDSALADGGEPVAGGSRALREAAALAAAHAETTRIENQALDDVLRAVIKSVWMTDETRARIARLIGKGGAGDEP